MAQSICPNCGHTHGTPGRRQARQADTLRDDMTIAERFAWFRRHAPQNDLRRLLRPGNPMSAGLRANAEAIARPTKADVVRLHETLNTERQAGERQAGEPAIGTEAWHIEQNRPVLAAILADVDISPALRIEAEALDAPTNEQMAGILATRQRERQAADDAARKAERQAIAS